MKRAAISKTLRFAVFQRDGFQCRYCGRRPPDVVLQVDHIMPSSAGGESELSNLVTSCPDCNQGKRHEIIVSPFEWEDSELRRLEALQRLAELRAYQDVKAELDQELAAITDGLMFRWSAIFGDAWQPAPEDIRYLLDDHDPAEIEKAFYLASRRSAGPPQEAWRYACAVLRNWRSEAQTGRTGEARAE